MEYEGEDFSKPLHPVVAAAWLITITVNGLAFAFTMVMHALRG